MNLFQLSFSTDSRFKVPHPCERMPEPYQRAGVEYLYKSLGYTILGDEPGLGKTIEIILYINFAKPRKVLIIVPSSLTGTWLVELRAWLLGGYRVGVYHPTCNPKDYDILLLGFYWCSDNPGRAEIIKHVVKSFKYELCVVDEPHLLGNPSSNRTKNVLAKNGYQAFADKFIASGGTLIRSWPIGFYPLLKRIAPDVIGHRDYYSYARYYCNAFHANWGFDVNGANIERLKELNLELRKYHLIRRTQKQVFTQMPKARRPRIVYLNEERKARTIIKRMQEFNEEAVLKNPKSPEFSELSTMRKELGILKAKACIEYAKTIYESGFKKIVIFAYHKEVIRLVAEGLQEYGVLTAVGGMGAKLQEQAFKFRDDPDTAFFIGSIPCCNFGLNGLTVSQYQIFFEYSFVWEDVKQAMHRLIRKGQLRTVFTDFLVFEDSFDEKTLRILLKKKRFESLFDGVA